MGNGRRSGKSSGKALGAMFVLLLAGAGLLGSGSHRHTRKAAAPVPGSPIATSSRPSLQSKPQQSEPQQSKPLQSKPLHSRQDARAILGQLPLIFEPNQGQADRGVKFLARGAGYSLFLDPTGAVLALQTPPSSRSKARTKTQSRQSEQFVSMKVVGANPAAATSGTDQLPGKSNYIVGNDPRKWHTGIPQFAGVHYASVYPGIDLVFYGNQGHLEYDFRVAPGADPAQPELQFDGATKLELSGGDLILTGLTPNGKDEGGLRLQAPQVYQRDGDRRQPVAGRFVLRAANRVGFQIGPYDRSRELIIDPVLKFSSYFGGSGAVTSPSLTVDLAGNIYLVGSTTPLATGFPGQSISTQIGPGNGIFVAKISPSQPPAVLYLTFLGGSGTDTSIGIGVDNKDFAYIVGNTTSPDFPTSGTNVLGYQTAPETKGPQCATITCTSVFVTVLNQLGSAPLSYSSYLSGNGNDQASGMTIDLNGNVYVTGTTTSNDVPAIFPTPDDFPATYLPVPYQTTPLSSVQFFVTKVNTSVPGAGSIAYSTYFGGSSPVPPIATGGGIAVDSTGNMYFSGTTNFFNSGNGSYGDSQSSDFPILNAYQPCLDTPPPTVLGVSNKCVAPATPYPTDAFVAKLNPNAQAGSQLLFSTYLGGSATDSGTAIAIDSGAANIYLTGSTNSTDFVLPTGTAAFQSCLDTPPPNVVPCPAITASPVPTDAYVARLSNPTLSTTGTPNDVALTYFSYLGGGGNDSGLAIAVLDTSSTTLGDIVVTGTTNSGTNSVVNNPPSFPVTTGAIQTSLNGLQNAFFAQINTTTVTGGNEIGSYVTYFGGNEVDRGTSIAVDTNLNTYFAGDTTSTANLTLVDPLQTALSGSKDAFVVKLGTATDLAITCVVPCVSPAVNLSAGNQVTTTFTLANDGPDPATNITVTGTVSPGATFNSASAGSGTCSAPTGNTAVCTIPALQSGSTSAVTFVVTPGNAGSYSVTAQVSNSNDTNPSGSSATANFQASGYKLGISPYAQSVAAGQLTTYSLTLTPTQGAFGANVSLSCGSLPGGATCTFAPSSTIMLNGPQTATLNLQTTPQPVPVANSGAWRGPLYALWLMVPGIAWLGLGAGGKRRRSGKKNRLLGLLTLGVLFALVLLQPSCSSGKTQPTVSGTPTGTYLLTATATSGSFSQSVSFSLTVSP
jgi:uncharacterized repeat protein (TIGR01451 family)